MPYKWDPCDPCCGESGGCYCFSNFKPPYDELKIRVTASGFVGATVPGNPFGTHICTQFEPGPDPNAYNGTHDIEFHSYSPGPDGCDIVEYRSVIATGPVSPGAPWCQGGPFPQTAEIWVSFGTNIPLLVGLPATRVRFEINYSVGPHTIGPPCVVGSHCRRTALLYDLFEPCVKSTIQTVPYAFQAQDAFFRYGPPESPGWPSSITVEVVPV